MFASILEAASKSWSRYFQLLLAIAWRRTIAYTSVLNATACWNATRSSSFCTPIHSNGARSVPTSVQRFCSCEARGVATNSIGRPARIEETAYKPEKRTYEPERTCGPRAERLYLVSLRRRRDHPPRPPVASAPSSLADQESSPLRRCHRAGVWPSFRHAFRRD